MLARVMIVGPIVAVALMAGAIVGEQHDWSAFALTCYGAIAALTGLAFAALGPWESL